MNKQEKEQPFSEVLDALFTNDPLPIYLLYRLSDMSAADTKVFRSRWTAVAADRRRLIVRHMADIAEENFFVDFVPVFRDCFTDDEPAVRAAALDGLWDATDLTLISPIIQLMETDDSAEVRTAAAVALSHYILLAEWEQIPRRASKPIIEALLRAYDDPDTVLSVRRAALEALGAADHPRVVDLIAAAYENSDPMMQMSAVYAMGSSADKRWLGTVLAEMENPDSAMRLEAARAAGTLGSSDAVTPLDNLLYDEDYEVRLAAVTALGQIGGDAARDILTQLADDQDSEDLWEAVDEAMEELSLFSGEMNLLDFDGDDFEDDVVSI